MDNLKSIIVVAAAALTGSGLAYMILLFYIATHPTKVDEWFKLFVRLGQAISRVTGFLATRVERATVAAEIQSVINRFTHEYSRELPGILEYTVKIQWLSASEAQQYLHKGEVVIRLDYQWNNERNLVVATLAYLQKGFLPRARVLMDEVLLTASEFIVARQVFASARDSGALSYFVEHHFRPAIAAAPELEKRCEEAAALDNAGFFSGIFLREVHELGERLLLRSPDRAVVEEVSGLFRFLVRIAKKSAKHDVPLAFNRRYIQLAVILLAREETYEDYGLEPYQTRLRQMLTEGFPVVYMAASGSFYVECVQKVVEWSETEDVAVLDDLTSFVANDPWLGSADAVLVRFTPDWEGVERELALFAPIRDFLRENVAEIRDNKWMIAAVAREEGIASKVALRVPKVDQSRVEWISKSLQKAVANLFGAEQLFLVVWSAEPRQFIINALGNLSSSDIVALRYDAHTRKAEVVVSSDGAAARAVSRQGWNIRLAHQLTRFEIMVRVQEPPTSARNPEVELGDFLTSLVPQIASGEMQLIRVVREVGVGSKVLLEWADDKETELRPSDVCWREWNSSDGRAASFLGPEWITFVDNTDDAEELVLRALYPLPVEQVIAIQVDLDNKLADVRVVDEMAARRASGAKRRNLRLAELLTDLSIKVEVAKRAPPMGV